MKNNTKNLLGISVSGQKRKKGKKDTATLVNERERTNWQRGANRTEGFVNIFILSRVDERKKERKVRPLRKVAADRLTLLAHTFVDRHIARTAAYNSRRDRSIFTIVCQTAAELTLRPGSFLLLLLLLLLLRFFVFLFSFFPHPFLLDDEPRKLGVSCV